MQISKLQFDAILHGHLIGYKRPKFRWWNCTYFFYSTSRDRPMFWNNLFVTEGENQDIGLLIITSATLVTLWLWHEHLILINCIVIFIIHNVEPLFSGWGDFWTCYNFFRGLLLCKQGRVPGYDNRSSDQRQCNISVNCQAIVFFFLCFFYLVIFCLFVLPCEPFVL